MNTFTLIATNFFKQFFFGFLVVAFLPITTHAQDGTLKMTADDQVEFLGEGGDIKDDRDVNRVLQSMAPQPSTDGMLRTNACAAGFIMNTPYNSNNGQRGCMFDITATNSVTIRCFESNVYAGTTANYEIYYRPGTHVGFENNAAAWTFLGGVTGITSAGNNLPTALPIPININIPAGLTYSFYITNDFGGGTSYTDGTAVGNFLAADANITVFEGVGKSYPFGLTFNVRNFNGHIFYDLGGVLDGEEVSLQGTSEADKVKLDWELPSNHQFQSMVLERSEDGLSFSTLTNLSLEQNGSREDEYQGLAQTLYYRLLMTNGEGHRSYSNTIEVKMISEGPFAIYKAYPNPFNFELALDIEQVGRGEVQLTLFDPVGKAVFEKGVMVEGGKQKLELDLPDLASGIYTLRVTSQGKAYTVRLAHQE